MVFDVHNFIGTLPRPKKGFVLPGHKYTGPYNPLESQLDKDDVPLPGQEPYNAVDSISMRHDICYRDGHNKHLCDDKMLQELEQLDPRGLRESIDKAVVKKIIGAKRKLGWGIDPPSTITWSNDLADELHKPKRKNFPKRRVFSKSPNHIWAADLVEMIPYSKQNKGYRYILTVIDIFSKFAWAVPMKRKTGVETTDAFAKLFKEQTPPTRIWVDDGKEFHNQNMYKLLEKHSIILYTTHNETKSCVVERFNRTLKTKMWKYFTANYTRKYIDILPALVEKYNKTYHRSIKTTPEEAMKRENTVKVFKALYDKDKEKQKEAGTSTSKALYDHIKALYDKDKDNDKEKEFGPPKFQVGDRVRITKKKNIFAKGFTPNWKDEIFIISRLKPTKPPTYVIRDERGEEVGGAFYEQELQKSHTTTYRIEKVLRRRTKGGKKQEYVKWTGYDSSHNQWINV